MRSSRAALPIACDVSLCILRVVAHKLLHLFRGAVLVAHSLVGITALVLFGVTIMCSHRRVPPNSVLTVQMRLSADTVLCFSKHHGALQFPRRSFQKSSIAIRLLVDRPAFAYL